VRTENEAAAIEYLRERGHAPTEMEKDSDGLTVFVFQPLPDDKLYRLVQDLPVHLSAKTAIVGNGPPFRSANDSIN